MHDDSCLGCVFMSLTFAAYIGSCAWMYRDTLRRGKGSSEAALWVILGFFFPLCIVPVYLIARQASPGIREGSTGFNMLDPSPQKQIEINVGSAQQLDMGKKLGKEVEILDYRVREKPVPDIKVLPAPVKEKKVYATLFDAVTGNALDQIREKVNTGTDINMQDHNGATPLHLAMNVNSRELTDLLISLGADIKAEDFDGKTPLHWAAATGTSENIDRLLHSYASVNARDYDGHTPLHDAASNGNAESAQRLISQGADPNAVDNVGRTPLDEAISNEDKEMESLLRFNGAKDLP